MGGQNSSAHLTSFTKLLLLLVITVMAGCASRPRGELFTESAIQVDPQKAQVVIYHNQSLGSGFSFLMSDGNQDLAVLSYMSFMALDAQPGPLEIFSDARVTKLILPPLSPLTAPLTAIGVAADANTNKKVDMKNIATLKVRAGEQYFYKLKIEKKAFHFEDATATLVAVDKKIALQDLKKTRQALLPST
ncbi:hypothetical protein [Salinimonas chungwhensis]|uniref:hypothetical protein n=1 Tax=Salinimonas chungwhensis TaxID=265425 RepID=UPI00036900D3|nr:hypothetical protein [Salinimonas chungwhensis]